MKNNLLSVLMLMSVVSIGCRAYGGMDQSLNLDGAIWLARENNPQLMKVRSSVETQDWKKTEAYSTFLPRFNLKADHGFANKFQVIDGELMGRQFSMPATYPYTTVTLEGTFLVFEGFNGVNTYRAANLEKSAAELQYDRTAFQLEGDVRQKFYQALSAKFLAEVAARNIQTLEEHLADVRTRERAGFSTRFDVLRIEVQLEEARSEKIAADTQISIARTRLFQQLGVNQDERLIEGELPVPTQEIVPESLAFDPQKRADLQALARQEDATGYMRTASRAHWYPKVALFGNMQTYNNIDHSVTDTGNFREAYLVGFSLSWNLFDGFASYAREQQARSRSDELSHGFDVAVLQAKVDFETWKKRYSYSLSEYQARLRSISKAEESVRLARIGLKAGTRTNMELLDAELDLMRTRAGLIKSQQEATDVLINLELASGKRLF